MARTAEYSIKGYLYQFLRYLSEILAADKDTKVTIEGAIEDIDVAAPGFTTAVQCKYHEAADKFTLSKIYKPILLMLEHFSQNTAATPEIRYRLFCHFPDQSGSRSLTKTELEAVLATGSEPMQKIIKRIAKGVDHDVFLARFTIEFGQTTDDLQKSVLDTLRSKGFTAEDVDAIIFPNAIQRIVDTATQSAIADRTVDPAAFIEALRDVRRLTFTRWTRALASRAQIARRLREDLAPSLQHNVRRRTFVIDPTAIEKFDEAIVGFVKAFVERYCCKYLHEYPPLFLITGSYDVAGLATRLHDAGLSVATGMVGSAFRAKALFKKPMRRRTPLEIEFRLGLAHRSLVTESPPQRPDELFLVNVADDAWAEKDVAVHRFEIERLSDLEYVLKLRTNYA
ncbi:hypothetical protein K9B33_11310 [Sphingobium sp. 3R8]|uniref:hypothetical protein n=1 Tax=Sphingobium sp. 3R8 TaxID=2874921 RepID=UPI001CCFCEAF|nr:hypothetical protein [Sphingobium sp. 3R8]MBZ9648137.1 hypothetical protein [Sphingobium sp. 3R8]